LAITEQHEAVTSLAIVRITRRRSREADADELRVLLDAMGLPTDPLDGLNLQG
jgi:hypothetical protein